jgi:hypothetical protein
MCDSGRGQAAGRTIRIFSGCEDFLWGCLDLPVAGVVRIALAATMGAWRHVRRERPSVAVRCRQPVA